MNLSCVRIEQQARWIWPQPLKLLSGLLGLLLSLLLSLSSHLAAYCPLQLSSFMSAGPEIYGLQRVRTGSCQRGRFEGLRLSWERLCPNSWYVGVDGLYATGILKGKTKQGQRLRSDLIDENTELRLGYTFQSWYCHTAWMTLFGGWGFSRQTNDFLPPSPLSYRTTDTFQYGAIGFIAFKHLPPFWLLSLQMTLRLMREGKSCITEEARALKARLTIQPEVHTRIAFSFLYLPASFSRRGLGYQCCPFYEYRHFGGREGYPFNFKETQFHLYGMKCALVYLF